MRLIPTNMSQEVDDPPEKLEPIKPLKSALKTPKPNLSASLPRQTTKQTEDLMKNIMDDIEMQ